MLIAEISNCHFGSMKKAKELIRVAHNSGADLIKGQAFRGIDIHSGSMPPEFYDQCSFSVDEYLEMIEYARELGNDMFFSVFSKNFEKLTMSQKWHKLTGTQTKEGKATELYDLENVIISVPSEMKLNDLYPFENAEILYVTPYLTQEPDLIRISMLRRWIGRTVGFSDHTIGIGWAIEAHQKYGAHIIERHFCLKKNESFRGKLYRDTIFGSTPDEFEKLAKVVSES